MSSFLNAAAIFSAPVVTVTVPVPEWGGTVCVKQMSVADRIDYFDTLHAYDREVLAYEDDQKLDERKRKGLTKPVFLDHMLLQVVRSVVDEKGQRIWSDADMANLHSVSNVAIKRIVDAVTSINVTTVVTNTKVEAEKKD